MAVWPEAAAPLPPPAAAELLLHLTLPLLRTAGGAGDGQGAQVIVEQLHPVRLAHVRCDL